MTADHRPVVDNSLLCFIQNFRDHPRVDFLTRSYFSECVHDKARKTLLQLLPESRASPSAEELSLFELVDRVSNLNPAPVFVTSDLTSLPFILIGDQDPNKNVLNEIHQLRFFIQSALTGSESTSKRIPSCSLSMSEDCNNGDPEAKEESCSSPVNLTTTNCRYSPIPGITSFHSDNAEVSSSQTTSPVSSTSVTPRKHSIRRHAPYRLDQAVRKLTDRLEAKLEGNEKSTTTEEKQNGVSQDESTEKPSPVENAPVINNFTPQQLFANNFFNPSSISNSTSGVDPLAFLMFKNFANTESQNPDITNNIFQKSKNNGDELSMGGVSGDEDEEEKMSNESSPTPSDSSNGKEYKYLKDNDKPFTCGQANCNKRFANKFLLKKHQFIHTGLRPHICPYCAKRFNRKDNLLRHKKTHLANATLPSDGRRRHHALLSPAPLESFHAFNPLNLLQISQNQNLADDAEDKKLDVI